VGNLDHQCNGKLRGRKGTLFEGGHRVPFIVRWPGKIKVGSSSDALITHLDMPATFAGLTGVKLPVGACPDSFNVLPALLGEKTSKPVRETFVAHNGGTKGPFAVRKGQWKLIEGGGKAEKGEAKRPVPSQLYLYNLASDLAETKDLAAENPGKVKELKAVLEKLRNQ
jgi:arylsulfatase A-like enzyme